MPHEDLGQPLRGRSAAARGRRGGGRAVRRRFTSTSWTAASRRPSVSARRWCNALVAKAALLVDVHLMVEQPLSWAVSFAALGARRVAFHLEAVTNPVAAAKAIRAEGASAYLAVLPGTPLSRVPDLPGAFDGLSASDGAAGRRPSRRKGADARQQPSDRLLDDRRRAHRAGPVRSAEGGGSRSRRRRNLAVRRRRLGGTRETSQPACRGLTSRARSVRRRSQRPGPTSTTPAATRRRDGRARLLTRPVWSPPPRSLGRMLFGARSRRRSASQPSAFVTDVRVKTSSLFQ